MIDANDDDVPRQFASPACFLHELSHEFAGTAPATPPKLTPEMAAWRKSERERLIQMRLELRPEQRAEMDAEILRELNQLIGEVEGKVVSAYWPFRCEPDLKPLLKRLAARGARTALPLVAGKAKPLIFREWKSGDQLERGVWNIPFPAKGAEVTPDIVIAPVVGFDAQCYRLGYGGGFFDRTLAAMPRLPRRIGVGYSFQRLEIFLPHRHDIPVEAVVTEEELVRPASF